MLVITPADFRPQVRIANRHPVTPSQSWGPRIIPDLQFICVLRGTLTLTTADGDTTTATAGEVLCIRPGLHHTVSHSGDEPGEMAGIPLELIPDARWADRDYRCNPNGPRIVP